MGFLLKIVIPEKVVFEGKVTSVILPTVLGEIEILEDHLPIVGLLEPGAAIYKINGQTNSIAVDTGFFRLRKDQLILLTEAAIDVQVLDASSIDAAVRRAQEALEKAKREQGANAEELERLDKMFRFQLAQQLTKQIRR
ncbi:MAG: ATP synthase F1 subunit epsilon [Puniceicoccales bacterium]|jgi:F-type H+-transporting ATPase subunit epsilon|nr:ATP synthase F1 subunit epsilon [Puniceicoccales bacterium]